MNKQVFNPYLPLHVHIPDGEPHVFGDRVYVYGSHDEEGGSDFCVLDYEVWSAPVNDLTSWSCPGTAYRAKQDPTWTPTRDYAMYASDCVQGNDGRYYLYYAMSGGHFTGPMHVAVSDKPDGPFEYYGCVRHPDGRDMTAYITFDPAVMNDDGVIRLYYGWSLDFIDQKIEELDLDEVHEFTKRFFEKSEEDVAALPEALMGANAVELEDDMLTIRHFPRRIVPGPIEAVGTGFEGHAFFEASSIRKIGDLYYFVYSSQHQHELCYATSRYPDRDFTFGGVIISNGDIGVDGRARKDRLMMTGNNHGGLLEIGGQWYIFYHRQTHRNTYSRQGCAEKIFFDAGGHIAQVEMTSCGLNDGPLHTRGSYPASICCCLTNGHMPHACNDNAPLPMPAITHEGEDHFISGIEEGVLVGYKYFAFAGETTLRITLRGEAAGKLYILLDDKETAAAAVTPGEAWHTAHAQLRAEGTHALYLKYEGEGSLDIRAFAFDAQEE